MVPAKCFSPAPKVKSCLMRFIKKDSPEKIAYENLEYFLNLFSPYSRKTLGRIAKMIEKK
jgi:16S rRNA A1518/A1519 N6-dimethyltransferase RsmA/KsgA/DIM1 with predicted DNA glycosylase/AP lyase activity